MVGPPGVTVRFIVTPGGVLGRCRWCAAPFATTPGGYRAEMARSIRAAALAAALAVTTACGGETSSTGPSAAGAAGSQPEAAGDAATFAGLRGVTVLGEGRVEAAPDTGRLVVGVEVVRPDVSAAFDEASSAASDVLDALR